MSNVSIDFTKVTGKIKPVHGVNSGPRTKNFTYNAVDLFRKASIPYCRTQDVEYPFGSGEYVDIHCIFKNFNADENDPASYDFILTDHYLAACREAGSDIVYRMGESSDYTPTKKYITPPKDFGKLARICEHIIRHYNEGWANGYNWNIEYWEIGNEPDLVGKMFNATKEEFYDLFETVALHLKKCFPALKIGGPATTGDVEWSVAFIKEMGRRNVPMDFFSWHKYAYKPESYRKANDYFVQALEESGYANAEIHVNEWNYMEDWDCQPASYRKLIAMRGAAFCGAMLTTFQHMKVDVANYFEADVTKEWCGIFQVKDMFLHNYEEGTPVGAMGKIPCPNVLSPRKPFYAFDAFGALYRLQNECKCESGHERLYACAASNGVDSAVMLVSYLYQFVSGEDSVVSLKGLPACGSTIRIYLTDEYHENECEATYDCAEESMNLKLRIFDEQIRLITVEPKK